MAQHIRFNNDNADDYTASDSDDDLSDNEKVLLKNARKSNKIQHDSENEVYGVNSDSDSSNESDLAESDIDGNEDDDLPDIRAWGKDKRNYYSTDYVDADYGGFDGKDAAFAAIEEEEAKNLQKKLAEQLDDDDYNLDFFTKKIDNDLQTNEETIESDLSKLSKRQKIQLLQKQSPELFGLIDDFKEQMVLIKDYIAPIISQFNENKISNCNAMDFVNEHYHLILNYCMNIYMYLLLKSSQQNIQNHPVVKRLYQYRQLLLQISPVFEEIIKPQVEGIINSISVNNELKNGEEEEDNKTKKTSKRKRKETISNKETKKKDMKEISISSDESCNEEDSIKISEDIQKLIKKDKQLLKIKKQLTAKQEKLKQKKKELGGLFEEGIQENDNTANDVDENDEDKIEDERRAITYQMAKNKGLMPHRKKEQRNPRVKHRNKYRKAKIRRKGAVREVRKELSRYGGEMSGIKATVTKSIKIKS